MLIPAVALLLPETRSHALTAAAAAAAAAAATAPDTKAGQKAGQTAGAPVPVPARVAWISAAWQHAGVRAVLFAAVLPEAALVAGSTTLPLYVHELGWSASRLGSFHSAWGLGGGLLGLGPLAWLLKPGRWQYSSGDSSSGDIAVVRRGRASRPAIDLPCNIPQAVRPHRRADRRPLLGLRHPRPRRLPFGGNRLVGPCLLTLTLTPNFRPNPNLNPTPTLPLDRLVLAPFIPAVALLRTCPASLLSKAAPPELRGEALGLLDAASSVARICMPILSGALIELHGVTAPFWLQAELPCLPTYLPALTCFTSLLLSVMPAYSLAAGGHGYGRCRHPLGRRRPACRACGR